MSLSIPTRQKLNLKQFWYNVWKNDAGHSFSCPCRIKIKFQNQKEDTGPGFIYIFVHNGYNYLGFKVDNSDSRGLTVDYTDAKIERRYLDGTYYAKVSFGMNDNLPGSVWCVFDAENFRYFQAALARMGSLIVDSIERMECSLPTTTNKNTFNANEHVDLKLANSQTNYTSQVLPLQRGMPSRDGPNCYFNSMVVCILSQPVFVKAIIDANLELPEYLDMEKPLRLLYIIYQELVAENESKMYYIASQHLKDFFCSLGSNRYYKKKQHDSHEFLIQTLLAINGEFNELSKGTAMDRVAKLINPAKDIFGFELEERVHCYACDNTSSQCCITFDLNLALQCEMMDDEGEKIEILFESLEECLNNKFGFKNDYRNCFYCGSSDPNKLKTCGRSISYPTIAVLRLDRTSNEVDNKWDEKNESDIHNPQTINLGKYNAFNVDLDFSKIGNGMLCTQDSLCSLAVVGDGYHPGVTTVGSTWQSRVASMLGIQHLNHVLVASRLALCHSCEPDTPNEKGEVQRSFFSALSFILTNDYDSEPTVGTKFFEYCQHYANEMANRMGKRHSEYMAFLQTVMQPTPTHEDLMDLASAVLNVKIWVYSDHQEFFNEWILFDQCDEEENGKQCLLLDYRGGNYYALCDFETSKKDRGQDLLLATSPLNAEYDLVAYNWHTGNTKEGHYASNILRDGKWSCFNDKNIVDIERKDEEYDRAVNSYVLFYKSR